MARRTWYALESIDIDPSTVANGDQPDVPVVISSPGPIEVAQTVEQAELDSNEVYNEADNLLDQGEDLVDDISKVETVQSNIETQDELNSVATESYVRSVNAICRRWGISGIKKPAVENYNSRDSRKLAQRVACESIKDRVKELVKRFIDWVMELVAKGKEVWSSFTNDGKAIQKRANKLHDAVANVDGAVPAKTKMDVSDITELQVTGKWAFNEIVSFASNAMNQFIRVASDLEIKMNTNLEIETNVGNFMPKYFDQYKIGKSMYNELKQQNLFHSTKFDAYPLIGNTALISYTVKELKQDSTRKVWNYIKLAVKPEKQEVDTLMPSQLRAAVAAMEDIGKSLESRIDGLRRKNDEMGKVANEMKLSVTGNDDINQNNIAKSRNAIASFKAIEKAVVMTLRLSAKGLDKAIVKSLKSYDKSDNAIAA